MVLTPASWIKTKINTTKTPLYNKTFKMDVSQKDISDFNEFTLSNPNSAKYQELNSVTEQVNNLTNSLDDYYATCVKLNQPATMQGYMTFLNDKMSIVLKNKNGIEKVTQAFNDIENQLSAAQNNMIKGKNSGDEDLIKNSENQLKSLQNQEAAYVNAINSSNAEMGKYVKSIQTKNEALRNSASTTKQTISSEQTQQVQLHRMTGARIADKAATIRQTAANMALNSVLMFGISTALSAVISLIQSAINKKKDLRESALEAADSLKQENETINDNISKITELREKLASGTATEQEAYDARKDLISIQSELYDSYGKELEGIDLVNGGLEEQLGLLRKIQAEKAKKYVIENDEAIKNARNELEGIKGYSFKLKKSDQDNSKTFTALDSYINNYLKNYADENSDVKLNNNYKHSQFTGTRKDGKIIFAPIKEQFKIWQEIYDEIENYGKEYSVDVSSYLSQVSDTLDKLNKKYKEEYDLLYNEASINEIQMDDSLSEYYNDITEAVKAYNEAVASGETGKAELNNISVLRDKLLNGEIKDQYGSDLQDEVQNYFNDMFDKYIDSINIKNFKTYFESLNKNEAESLTKAFNTMTDIDVKNIENNSKATKEQLAAYERLKNIADKYDISIENAVDAMVDLKIVTGAVEKSAKNTATAYDTMLESYSNTQSGIEKFNSAYSKILTGQDLTADEVNELITLYPALIDQLEKTKNGYTISINKLIAARNQYASKNLESEVNEINSLQKQINSYNNKLAETQKKHSEFNKQLETKKQELVTGIRTTEGNNYLNGVWNPLTQSVEEGSKEVTQILYDSYTGYIRKLKDGSVEILGKDYKPLGGRVDAYGADNTGAVFVENLKVLKSEYAEEINNEIASIENGINNCTKSEQEWIERIEESETELQRRKFLYEQTLASQSINWADDFKAVREAYTSMTSIKDAAASEMSSSGFLSSDTLEQIISSTDRWGECLTEVNGKMMFNADVYQKIIEEESGYDFVVNKARKTQEQFNHSLENKTTALKLLAKQYGVVYDESKSYLENLNAVKAKALETNAGNKDVVQSLTKLGDEWATLTNSLTDCNSELSIFLNIMKQIAEENQIDEMLSNFESSVSKMQHELQMGRMTQNAFNAWYSSEWNKVKSGIDYNSLNSASQSTYNGFDEQNYSQQLETQQSLYEHDKLELDNLLEDKLISYQTYCQRWQALNDKYFGKGSLLGNTEDGAKTYASNNREISAYSKNTYDDLITRIDKSIDTGIIDDKLFEDIQAIFGDDIPQEVLDAINEAAANGKITYGQSSVLAKYLSDELLSTVPSLADDYADALEDAAQRKQSEFNKRIETLDNEKELTDMSAEKYWSEYDKIRKECLEDDIRLTEENEDEKRKVALNADKDIFDEKIKELDREKELGDITAEVYWTKRERYAEQYLKNNKALTEEYTDEQTSYATTALQEMYDEQANLLERQLKNGDISYSQYIDGLLQAWTKYYKNRKGMEAEAQSAMEAVVDATKSGVEEQISALEQLNEQNAHPYEVEIEALEDAKEAQDEYYDSCIDSIQDKLDLLEDEQEQEEKLNAIEEKRLSLLEAERNMYKNIRLVYAGNGQWVQKAREEDIQAVKEAEKALEDEQNQTEIEKLQEEIDKLQKEKEQYDEGLDKEIENLNQQIKDIQAPINDLIDILKLIVAEQYNVDPDLIHQLINSERGQAALSEKNDDNNKKAETFNNNTEDIDKKDAQDITDDTFDKVFNKLEKNNKTYPDYIKSLGIDIEKDSSKENSINSDNTSATSQTDKNKSVNQADTAKNTIVPLSEYIRTVDNIPENIKLLADSLDIMGAKLKNSFMKTGVDSIDINKTTKDSLDRVSSISANIVTTVNVSGDSANSQELANTIASTCESKITAAFTEFGNVFSNNLKKNLYGNT